MGSPVCGFLKQNNIIFLRFFAILVLSCIPDRTNLCSNPSFDTPTIPPHSSSSSIPSSLKTLTLDGYFSFENLKHAAKDFDKENADLFYGVLGGLGQFGIITRARISLGPAEKMVKWIRVLYSEFSTFSNDQEHLISSNNSFDYIEGFVMINRTGLLNNWRSSFNPKDPIQASQFSSDGKILYCLEMVKYFNPEKIDVLNQDIEKLLSELNYIPSTLFLSEVSYVEFLDRVHLSEIKLRSKGLWEVPHPWLNLLIPKSRILDFAEGVFGNIVKDNNNGPILIYPVNKAKWNNRTSMVTPEEDIIYLVAFLSSALPGTDGLEHIMTQNQHILDFCAKAQLGAKQYLPHYHTQDEWRAHFGTQWETFVQRKSAYDPLAILAPGQRIFQKAISIT